MSMSFETELRGLVATGLGARRRAGECLERELRELGDWLDDPALEREHRRDVLEGAESRRLERERRGRSDGFSGGSFQCFSCRRFKGRPASVCGYCGDDPVPHGTARRDFDVAHGFDPATSEGGAAGYD